MTQTVIIGIVAVVIVFVALGLAVARRYKRCPSDRILVVYGKVGSKGSQRMSAKCLHGGAAYIWPMVQDYAFLDLKPLAIDINLQGALSMQNIRVNTPSTFTVGISTEPGVMENAAERVLGLQMPQIAELARDIIFGQMRVVLATMPIEDINADRDKLIENISNGVEVELKKVGLRLINVNIQDITDESGYIDALGKEAAARAINEAKIKVAEQERDGEIGSAHAERARRVEVATAKATAVEGENVAKITVAESDAKRREREAEAERLATAAEKVKTAQALEEAYKAEEISERQRAKREEATQHANIVVPAEIQKRRIETLAEAEAEKIRRLKKGEADGLRSLMEAEAEGLKAILTRKAEGFDEIVGAAKGVPELASLLLVTEQLPTLVEEQVKAISNLKIDKITVWEGGRGEGGKTATADFLSGLVASLPPLHELTKNVGIKLPEYFGTTSPGGDTGGEGGSSGAGGGKGGPAGGGAGSEPRSAPRGKVKSALVPPDHPQHPEEGEASARKDQAAEPPREPPSEVEAKPEDMPATPDATDNGGDSPAGYPDLRSWIEAHTQLLTGLDKNRDQELDEKEIKDAIQAAYTWAGKTRDGRAAWYYAEEGRWVGPRTWNHIRHLAEEKPELPVHLDKAKMWLPYGAIAKALES